MTSGQMHGKMRNVTIGLILTAFFFGAIVPLYNIYVGLDGDEAELILFSERIGQGELPYRDYVYHYGTVPVYLNYDVKGPWG